MPNARQVGYSPTPATPETPFPQANVAQDILNLVQGGGKAIAGFAEVAAQQVEKQNQDLKTYLKFGEAAEKAQRELGVAKERNKATKIENDLAVINIADAYYEKLKRQERMGIVSLADGRTKEQLIELLKSNPEIVDPENALEWRQTLGQKLAVLSANEIFQRVSSDENRIADPTGTIGKYVDQAIEGIRSQGTLDLDSERAFIETLLPMMVNKQESLLLAGNKKRLEEDIATSIIVAQSDLEHQMNTREIDGQRFDSMTEILADRIQQLSPETSRPDARSQARGSLFALFKGDTRVVDPRQALELLDKIESTAPDNWKKNKDNVLAFNALRTNVMMDVYQLQNQEASNFVQVIQMSDYANLTVLKSELEKESTIYRVGNFNIPKLQSAINSKEKSLRSEYVSSIKQQIDEGLQTPDNAQVLQQNIDDLLKNKIITATEYSDLNAKISKGMSDNRFQHDVYNRLMNKPTSENITFNENHYKGIDYYDSQDKASGIPLEIRLSNTLSRFGLITDNQVTELNGMMNSSNPKDVVAALSAIGYASQSVGNQYFGTMRGSLEKLDRKGQTLVFMASQFGINPQMLVEQTKNSTPFTFTRGEKAIVNLGDITPIIKDGLTEYLTSDAPDYISPKVYELSRNYARYSYAVQENFMSDIGTGDTPSKSIDVKNEVKNGAQRLSQNVEFAGKRYIVPKNEVFTNPSLLQGTSELGIAIETAIGNMSTADTDLIFFGIDNAKVVNNNYEIPVIDRSNIVPVTLGKMILPVDDVQRQQMIAQWNLSVARTPEERASYQNYFQLTTQDASINYYRLQKGMETFFVPSPEFRRKVLNQ